MDSGFTMRGESAGDLFQAQKSPTGVRLDVGFAALPRLSELRCHFRLSGCQDRAKLQPITS